MSQDCRFELSSEQIALLPDDKDVAFYKEHGWYVSPKIIDDDLIEETLIGVDEFHRGERDVHLPRVVEYVDWKQGDPDQLRINEFTSLQNRRIARLVHDPMIGAIAARLTRTSQIRLLDDQIIAKASNSTPDATVGWHTDKAYWGTCSSDELLTAWIPLHDVDEERAPIVVLDKSHKWSGLSHSRFFRDPMGDTEKFFREQGHEIKPIPMILQKGQMSFHNARTVHGSYPNRSNSPRVALAIHMQDRDNAYRACRDPAGKDVHIANEAFCRTLPNGEPDFADPAIFPVLWEDH